uniref:Putative LAGLIDADG homing endonuclease n=1 Tax=Prasiolopsis wulf-kochii TaxID=3239232 RepID=A0A097KK11_9CHLO|nr:putative LAGLIDADG homing endonuclease [Prasiolopsis sp. SAG 84.81]
MQDIEQLKLAWLAGFIDADGSINAQIIRRDDYVLKYQVRVSLTVFQSTKRHHILLYIQKLVGKGTIRKRNDGMSEFCVVGATQVKFSLESILPYLKLKKPQAKLVLEIIQKLPYTKNAYVLLQACVLTDKIGMLTDGKKRTIKSDEVRTTLQALGHDV